MFRSYFREDAKSHDTVLYSIAKNRLYVTVSFSDCSIVRRPSRLLTQTAAAVNATVSDACRYLSEPDVRAISFSDDSPDVVDEMTREYFGGIEHGYIGSETDA